MTSTTQALIDRAMADPSRANTIAAIRAALRERSGKAWSVTGGRGTAYGWITIKAPPARCDGYSMTDADTAELTQLLGLTRSVGQHESIPASDDFRRVAIQRAATGSANGYSADPYWD